MLPDCLEPLSSTLCQISALEEAIGYYVYGHGISIFLKWEYFKCTILLNICTFSFLSCYDIGCTCLDNIFVVLLISELAKIGVTKPFYLDSGLPGGEGGLCMHGHGVFSLYSS